MFNKIVSEKNVRCLDRLRVGGAEKFLFHSLIRRDADAELYGWANNFNRWCSRRRLWRG